ncbi:MAG: hypothetical protein JSS96_13620 [Bacteroidetes bacterium]|nr:hypothetical protein [Bacteroidota bacterium]
MYLGTDGGVYYSLDRGATWMFVHNLPVGQFYHVATDNQKPYRIYGGLQDNGSWVAPSSAPGGVGNANWMNIYGGDGFWATPDLTDANTAYAEYQGGNMGRIDLTTLKSVDIKPQEVKGDEKLRWNWNTPIVGGQANKHNLYTGAQYLYKTTNQGRSWEKISPDLTTNDKKKQKQEESGGLSEDNTSAENHCTIFTIAESPLDENMIWAGTDDGNLQLTTNGGKSWTNLAKNYASAGIPAQTWISSIEPSHFDKNVVYVTFDNHMYGDMKTYVARSADGGKTWKAFTSEDFTGYANKIKEDLVNKDLLFLGTERGLFGSIDGGESWFRMKNHIPDYCMVRDITIQPQTNDLLIATHGRGIMIVEDITPMRNLTKDIREKDVYLFTNKSIAINTGQYGGGGYSTSGGWDGGNPDDIPPIEYYLKDRVNVGDVKLEIYDAAGNLVQSLPGTKRKGVNKVYWNLRMTPPKTATGGSKADFGGFVAPMVMPGTYTVKLKVADKEYSSQLTMIHDATNKNFSEADRELQYKTAMNLYHMHEQLYQLVEKINTAEKMIKDTLATVKNPQTKKLLTEYNTKLETLRATLLATKHKSIFADEKKLREEITEVYGAVCGQECKPTNLQVARVSVLQDDLKKGQDSYETIDHSYAPKVQTALAAEKPKTIEKASPSRSSN